MNKEFIIKTMWKAHYSLKGGTNSSYIYCPYLPIEALEDRRAKAEATLKFIDQLQDGQKEMLLPFRICFITGEESAPVSNTGRGARQKVAQLKASFTKPEISPYKIAKPYRVCTSVWQIEGRKCLFYGTIGITFKENQKPKDNGDLVLFYTPDWKEVDVYIFKGLVRPNDVANLQDAVEFVEDDVQKM